MLNINCEYNRIQKEGFINNKKLVICLVGLPARGKTYISRKVSRYLNWLGYKSSVFTIENYRRTIIGTDVAKHFFDPQNESTKKQIERCAEEARQDLIQFLCDGDVAIYDGTNCTKERRRIIKSHLDQQLLDYDLMWIECKIQDQDELAQNIDSQRINNPDFQNLDKNQALEVYKLKNLFFEQSYDTIEDDEYEGIAYMKINDCGKKVQINNVSGYLQQKIQYFILNLQNKVQRPIYFTRHGESEYNVQDRIGGDCDLSPSGKLYPVHLNSFFQQEVQSHPNQQQIKILTSTLKRAHQTAAAINIGVQPIVLKNLDEISSGIYDGFTYEKIKQEYPEDHKQRALDKLRYRYPRGESYIDLVQRIEPILIEIESSKYPVIVVAHQAVIRCLYAYFTIQKIEDIPFLDVPLHTVIKLEPEAYICKETRFEIDIYDGSVKQKQVKGPQMIGGKDFRMI